MPSILPSWLGAEQVGAVTVLRFRPDAMLDAGAIDTLEGMLLPRGESSGSRHFVLNFANVADSHTLMTSLVMGKLLALHGAVGASGGRLALCQFRPEVAAVLESFKLTHVLNVYGDEQEALQSFATSTVGNVAQNGETPHPV